MTIQEALARLLDGQDLTRGEARDVMNQIMSGEATPGTDGRLPRRAQAEGRAGRRDRRAAPRRCASTCSRCGHSGTTWWTPQVPAATGARTFNISTAAALVAAAAGAGVAKHGNRAVSSASGSADVLEALGFRLDLAPPQIERSIDELGFGFLFAQTHHPAMRHAAPVRRELATRTIFNVLGPLTNPAGARAQVVGVYAPELVETIASVLADSRRAASVRRPRRWRDRRAFAGGAEPRLRGRRRRRHAAGDRPGGLRRPALLLCRPRRRHARGERRRRPRDPGRRAGPEAGGGAAERRGRNRRRRPCPRSGGGLRPGRRGGRLRRRGRHVSRRSSPSRSRRSCPREPRPGPGLGHGRRGTSAQTGARSQPWPVSRACPRRPRPGARHLAMAVEDSAADGTLQGRTRRREGSGRSRR